MSVRYQLNNAANWREVWAESFTAERISDKFYLPIPEQVVPVLVESTVIAIFCDSNSKKSYYKRGGYVRQRFGTGLTGGGGFDTYGDKKGWLYVGRVTVLTFPELVSEYALALNVPYWFEDINYTVWEYTGETIDPVIQSLERIEDVLSEQI